MASNRLFIYDPKTKTAVCIAKGYADGWCSDKKYIDDFFGEAKEFTPVLLKTRYQLKTERDLPSKTMVFWQSGKAIF